RRGPDGHGPRRHEAPRGRREAARRREARDRAPVRAGRADDSGGAGEMIARRLWPSSTACVSATQATVVSEDKIPLTDCLEYVSISIVDARAATRPDARAAARERRRQESARAPRE